MFKKIKKINDLMLSATGDPVDRIAQIGDQIDNLIDTLEFPLSSFSQPAVVAIVEGLVKILICLIIFFFIIFIFIFFLFIYSFFYLFFLFIYLFIFFFEIRNNKSCWLIWSQNNTQREKINSIKQ